MPGVNDDDTTWEYLPVLNECINVLLTTGIGILMGYVQVLNVQTFLPQATKFIFNVALPLHILKGLGIGIDFYDNSFLWTFIAAFLILRVIALVVCFVLVFAGSGRNNHNNNNNNNKSRGGTSMIGDVAVMWLALTWISTIILGVPIAGAVFGNPAKGRTYGILAAISSFIFQLPVQLFLLECHVLEKEYVMAGPGGGGTNDDNSNGNGNGNDDSRRVTTAPLIQTKDGVEFDPEQPPPQQATVLDIKDAPLSEEEEVDEEEQQQQQQHPVEENNNIIVPPKEAAEPVVEAQIIVSESSVEPPTAAAPSQREVTLALWMQWAGTWSIWKKIFKQLSRNPVLGGILVGFFFSLTTIGPRFLNPTSDEYVPGLGWIFATTTWLGECVSPVALIAMGVWMQAQGAKLIRIPLLSVFLYMLAKLVLVPLVMIGLAKLVGLNDEAGRAAVLIAALPISMASFSLADRYDIGQAVLSENVALGTVLILPTIILWNLVLDSLDVFPI